MASMQLKPCPGPAFSDKNIMRIDVDNVDPDNAEMIVVAAVKSRRKGCVLHIFLIGRPINSLLAAAVMVDDKPLELEVDGKLVMVDKYLELEVNGELVRILPNKLGGYLMQTASDVYNLEEGELLLGLSAMHVRFMMNELKFVEGIDYEIYNGGVAPDGGISAIIHHTEYVTHYGGVEFGAPGFKINEFDFESHFAATCGQIATYSEITSFKKCWHQLPLELRPSTFRKIATAPPEAYRRMRPVDDFYELCRQNPEAKIDCFVGGPLTALAKTPQDIADRVSKVVAMSGSWNGSKNLLGVCFNNAVDMPSTIVCLTGLFRFATILLVPTEPIKNEFNTFTFTSNEFKEIGDPKVMHYLIIMRDVWTELQRGIPQPVFDVTTLLPVETFLKHASIIEVNVEFGKNIHKIGSYFEDKGMTLHSVGEPITDKSEMEPGKVYAVMDNVKPSMKLAFTDYLMAICSELGPPITHHSFDQYNLKNPKKAKAEV
jgi:hypothetical protein